MRLPAQSSALADHRHRITEDWLEDGAVPTAKLADDAVTAAKVADGAIDSLDKLTAAVITALMPTGTVIATGRSSSPSSEWLLCDGSAVSRTTYADLFAAIGTAYGVGDGSTTFNLPDLQQRFPLGKATSGTGSTLGGTGGSIDHVHGLDTASSHARVAFGTGTPGTSRSQRKSTTSWTETHTLSANGSTGAAAVTLGTALGGDSDTENPPFQVFNFLIRT